jgi:hypothetical protein
LLLGPDALADIERNSGHAHGAVGVRQREFHIQPMVHDSIRVGTADDCLHRRSAALNGQVMISRLLDRRPGGPAHFKVVVPEKLCGTLANHFLKWAAKVRVTQCAVLDPGNSRRVVHKHLESLVGFPQRLLGVALLADVARDAAIAFESPMLIKHG